MNILIVDDQAENIYLLEALLRGNGYETRSAVNGAEALQRLQSEGCDLIISDILMPVMDGFELCRRVKTDENLRQIPFIVYTATYTGPQDEALALKIGADRFIVKPCEPDVFLEAIRDVTAAAKRVDNAATPAPPQEEEILKLYNERLVRKLEQKMLQLESNALARQEAEEALRRNKEYIEKIIASVNDGLSVLDLEGRHVMVNPALCSITGFSPEELLGHGFPQPYWPEEEMEVIQEVLQKVAKGELKDYHLVFKRKSGERFPVLFSPNIIHDENGKVLHYIATIKDVTEFRQMESQLHQAQKMEALGQLTGGIAHDFNNMLSPILGYAGLLLDDTQPEDPRYHEIQQIIHAAERAKDLTWQLLAFSRKQIMEMKITDLGEVIADFQKILIRTIREDITIRVVLSPKPNPIWADPGKIGQILMNLAVNAQDAMPGGGIITIETADTVLDEAYTVVHPDLMPGNYALLTFSDTGSGMDRPTIEHIFEPFYTTKQPGKGTGLGLATVFGIVKQHNGHIMVYSELGIGTTFRIYLPKAEKEEGPGEKLCERNEIRHGTETILVVEDEDAVRGLISRILKMYGYRVISAGNAQECFQAIEHFQESLHLLITDVIMPEINGKQLYESLAISIPGLKVIFLSGYPYDVLAEHGVLIQGTNLISKPFTARDLAGKVRSVLDG